MTYLSSRSVLDEIASHGIDVFDINDLVKIYGKPKSYVSKVLSRSKNVNRLERGKYFFVGADFYEIASNIVFPSYVSLLPAFSYYGLTEQEPVVFSIVSLKRHKNMVAEGKKIEFLSIRRDRFFGYKKNNNAFIAEPEKAILDALYFNRLAFSYTEEAVKNGIDAGVLDATKLKEYALRFKSSTLINKVGFILESNDIDAVDLLPYISKAYIRQIAN